MVKKEDKTYEISSENIFADLGFENADELFAKAKLMHELGTLIKSSKFTQKEIAKKLGISQPKVSMIISGKFDEFSADTLLHYLSLMGCSVEIRVKKPRITFRRRGRIAVV
jgi:predicted XRE-type DNA-binding protein